MDGGAWWAAVHGVTKSDFIFTFPFHALEKEMATHSSVLAWRIPGTGEPGGFRLWGRTESDTTEATSQQQQQVKDAEDLIGAVAGQGCFLYFKLGLLLTPPEFQWKCFQGLHH